MLRVMVPDDWTHVRGILQVRKFFSDDWTHARGAVAVLAEFLLLFAGMRLVEKVARAVSSILLAFAPRPLFRRE